MQRPLSYFEVSRSALRHNVHRVRDIVGDHQQIIAVVKANAYGHGLPETVEAVGDLVDGFQVDDIEELRQLRHETPLRALVLGYVQPADLTEAVELGGELAVYDVERVRLLASLGSVEEPVRVHLKIDALLGRQGVSLDQLESLLVAIKNPAIELAGVYMHFANLEDTTSHAHAQKQLAYYEEALGFIRRHGFVDFQEHASASAGIMIFEGPKSPRQLVRLGVSLYGLYPSAQLAKQHKHLKLQPALRWISHLAQVKLMPAGHPIGYGLTHTTSKPIPVGIVPQGYSDGFDRAHSNRGAVLVAGNRCPVLGRVAMNMFAIDLSSVPDTHAGDEVVLLGNQGSACITAEELAETTDTINYEVIARLNPLLPRFLVD